MPQARLADEQAAMKIRPFFMELAGKQQRSTTPPTRPSWAWTATSVNRSGDAPVGFGSGIAYRVSPHWSFDPAIRVAINLEKVTTTSPHSAGLALRASRCEERTKKHQLDVSFEWRQFVARRFFSLSVIITPL